MTASVPGPTFDRDAYLSAVEPPVFVAGGIRYVGRVLSWEEWLPIEARFEAAATATKAEIVATIRLLCDAMFPPPPWWRRWAAPPRVYDWVRELPFSGQLAAIRSFASRQAEIQRGPRLTESSPPPNPTDGTPSPA